MTGQSSLPDRIIRILPYVIALLTVIVYSSVLWHDFINYDDPAIVIENPAVRAGLTWDSFLWAFSTGYLGNWIPLTWLSHMLDVQLFGIQPAGHHAINLLLHVASSILLYLFLKQATAAPWKSAAVAMLFALHPLHVESVAWVSERKDVLSTFFAMLCLCAYSRYSLTPSLKRYLLVLLLFTCGLLAKSMLVTMPLLLLLLDYWPLGRLTRTTFLQLLREKIPFALLAAGSGLLTLQAHRAMGGISESYTLTARAGKAALAYLAYIGKMVWPTKLGVIYSFSLYPPSSELIVAAVVTLLAITTAVFWVRRTYPYLAVGWLWYAVSLFPVCGLLQIGWHSIADRYTYIPLIGLFCIIAWGVPEIAQRLKLPAALIPSGAVLATLVMVILTFRQVSYWQDSISLLRHTLAVTKNNWIAHAGLGLALSNANEEEEAINQFQAAIKAKPSYTFAYQNLGFVYFRRGDLHKAMEAYIIAGTFEPNNPVAHLYLGFLYLQTGYKDAAIAEHTILLGLNTEYAAELMRAISSRDKVQMPAVVLKDSSQHK